ncbi:MAG: DUF89 family protein [Armatimonadetes bacterium]|nr:DUF89 family protein [Armatimonadota bacterium]
MRAYPECLACTVNQGLRAARHGTEDPSTRERALRAVLAELADADFTRTPVELGHLAQQVVARVTGVADPYREACARSNEEALRLYPRLKKIVRGSKEPLRTAATVAIIGNLIDLGAHGEGYDLEGTLTRLLASPFGRDDFLTFRAALSRAKRVLYLADNAGEIVFDRVLMEEMDGAEITVAVKSEPFINDAQPADAEQAGVTAIARVIATPIFPRQSAELVEAWREADVIISKGHANYESYDEAEGPRFFLLLAKCDFVAHSAGVNKGDMVLLARPGA